MKENEYRFIDNDITNSGIISSPIKLIIGARINYREKLRKKINDENIHFFEKGTNKYDFDYSIIILNCKYFMYNNIFYDCQSLLEKYGNKNLYKNKKLIGVLIIYPKDDKDISFSLDPNLLVLNPHCGHNPFTNITVYKNQKFTNYGIPMVMTYSIPEGTKHIHIKEYIKIAHEEVINKYYPRGSLGYHTIGTKNLKLFNVTVK